MMCMSSLCVQDAHHETEQYVFVDAHVLTTPNIADIDGDGHEELVLAVSYFYDREWVTGKQGME